ncbi:MAG: dockerin type I domain-containing protein [Candidatus Zixiibacteriota bacterium]
MRKFNGLLFWAFVIMLSLCTANLSAQDPGVADTVRIGSVSGDVRTALSVPVSLYNDESLTSVILPVLINGYSGWMTFDSITYAGGRLDGGVVLPEREAYSYYTDTFSVEAVIVRFSVSSGDPLPPGDGVICDLWFSPKFGGEVILDTMSVSPYGNLRLIDYALTDFLPQFQLGSADIACDYIIGDLNDDGATNVGDYLAIQKFYYGCNPIGPYLPYIGDLTGDRRVDLRDANYLIHQIYYSAPPLQCGEYTASSYSDPGIPDTLYIENAVLYEGVPGYIAIDLTNDEAISLFGIAFEWSGDADLYCEWFTQVSSLETRVPAMANVQPYSCGSQDEGTSGKGSFFSFQTMGAFICPDMLEPGSGPIHHIYVEPRSIGSSTFQLKPFEVSGADWLFITLDRTAFQPVVVGGNITVLPRPCGDANRDGNVNIGDGVYIINYIFKSGAAPDPQCIADVNGDGNTNIGDAVYLVTYIFKGGPAPVEDCCAVE